MTIAPDRTEPMPTVEEILAFAARANAQAPKDPCVEESFADAAKKPPEPPPWAKFGSDGDDIFFG